MAAVVGTRMAAVVAVGMHFVVGSLPEVVVVVEDGSCAVAVVAAS